MTSRGLSPRNKACVHGFPLSTTLIVSPRRVVGLHPRTRLGSTFCLSPQAQRVSSRSHGLAPLDKDWVHVFPLFTRLIVSPRRVAARTPRHGLGLRFASFHQVQRVSSPIAGLHRRTRYGSTLCLPPTGSAFFLIESLGRTAGQYLGPGFASLYQAQSVFSPIRGLASVNKSWVQFFPLFTRLSVSSRLVASSHCATSLGSTFCLSPQDQACFLA